MAVSSEDMEVLLLSARKDSVAVQSVLSNGLSQAGRILIAGDSRWAGIMAELWTSSEFPPFRCGK
jgi:hypothetical protein